MSLLFNTLLLYSLRKLNIIVSLLPHLPSSKCLLILWQQSLSAVILEPPKIKCLTVVVSASIYHEVMELDAMILVF